ncbi:uncharacterized protein LOC126745361 [Anthonomus grandis grandis]|uniref:uncharacterized protein LOC126745361 n=1 Tax=Anthonomus grandis grandis TaxID=2921223 RepID=UPI00216577AF|nr:uncharacterized protein LOC126745361 [Anthonomus grandis grandis]
MEEDLTAVAQPSLSQAETSFVASSYPGGRDFVRQAFLRRGIPLLGISPIISSLAPSTFTQYNIYYRKWWSFCMSQSKSPYKYSLDTLFLFLTEQYNTGASYSTLNSQYSALSFVFSSIDKEKIFFKRFLKGIYRQKPPQPKYQITWDPSLALDYLAKIYPLPEVPMPKLTCKLVTLLALVTGHRIQTLSKIRIKNIAHFSNRLEIKIPDLIKTSSRNNCQPLLVVPYISENPSLCLASVIDEYIQRTQTHRSNEDDWLILTYAKPVHPATTQRISKWIKNTLSDSGVDINYFSSHSTRHAATSAAYRAGVSIEVIRKAAGWTQKSNTFNTFYNRPLSSDSTLFARSILNKSINV